MVMKFKVENEVREWSIDGNELWKWEKVWRWK